MQVVFEGIRGPGYEGDIAIDDVSITIGKCKLDNTVASAGKTGKICVFVESRLNVSKAARTSKLFLFNCLTGVKKYR